MFYQKKTLCNGKIWIPHLGKELKTQTDIANKQYQKLDKMIKKEALTLKNYNKLNLIYNCKYSFYKYYSERKNLIIFYSNQFMLFYTNF